MSFNIHSEELRAALADRLGGVPKVRTAFIGGSLVEGFGNSTSDVDLLVLADAVVTAADLPLDRPGDFVVADRQRIWVSEIQGRRLDIEFRWTADFEHARDALSGGSEGADPDRSWLEFFHSLRTGIPVVDAVEYERTRQSFPWIPLRRRLVEQFEFAANSSLDDAAGAITAADAGTALLASRAALGAAVEALLASLGSTNPRAKWRFRKLDQFEQAELRGRYLELETDPSGVPADLLARSRERVAFAQDLLIDAQANLFRSEAAGE